MFEKNTVDRNSLVSQCKKVRDRPRHITVRETVVVRNTVVVEIPRVRPRVPQSRPTVGREACGRRVARARETNCVR